MIFFAKHAESKTGRAGLGLRVLSANVQRAKPLRTLVQAQRSRAKSQALPWYRLEKPGCGAHFRKNALETTSDKRARGRFASVPGVPPNNSFVELHAFVDKMTLQKSVRVAKFDHGRPPLWEPLISFGVTISLTLPHALAAVGRTPHRADHATATRTRPRQLTSEKRSSDSGGGTGATHGNPGFGKKLNSVLAPHPTIPPIRMP